MEILAGLSVLVLLLAALAIAVKTILLWRRTRGVPELLLSLYLVCATIVGYPLAIAMTLVPASEGWAIHVLGQWVMALGWVCLFLFTLKVFRPEELWARILVALSLSAVLASSIFYAIEVTGESPRAPQEMPRFVLLLSLPMAVGYAWTACESLLYHRQLRKRQRLGLAAAGLVNRMLLWGLMAVAAGTAVLLNMAALLAGSYMSAPVVLVSSVLGVAHAGCLFLAFHPPAWYAGWVERRSPLPGT
jgi:hypothetical protein